ncbi:MAG: 16S rRNA (uracil(1498)-N(3))-methyltransferase [Pseudomonadota bacterium]
MKRLFIEGPLGDNTAHTLDADDAHYLGRVLRARVGDSLTVFDRDGKTGEARIAQLARRHAELEIGTLTVVDDRSPVRTTLLQALSRSNKIDWVIQKAVELGVDEIRPVATERSAMRVDELRADHKLAHWRKIAIGACQQCGRVRLPEIHSPETLDLSLQHTIADVRLVASPVATVPLRERLQTPAAASVALLVGPEGGLSEDEIRQCDAAGWQPVRAGRRVLRTETAAISLLSIVQYAWGDLT